MVSVLQCAGGVGRACSAGGRVRIGCALAVGFVLSVLGHTAPAHAAEPPDYPPSESAARKYDESFIFVEGTRIGGYAVNSTPGGGPAYVLPGDIWEAYRGRARHKLGLLEFYDAVDRPDLRSDALTHYVLRALQLGLPSAINGSTERDSVLRFARPSSSLPALLGIQGLTLALQL